MADISAYKGIEPAWCPGCGNFAILRAFNQAMVTMGLEPHQILMVSGIGQAGKLPHYSRGNIFNSLHGRALSPATAAKTANPELVVIAIGGDGDGYGEGGNHFIHSCRRNHDITYLVHNNQVYGLTKGQASPTSDADFITKTTPTGAPYPLNPMALAIVSGATFVARAFAGDIEHLTGIISQAVHHKGFSLVDILQPCPSFNRKNTLAWYREGIYKLENETGYNSGDKKAALIKALEWGEAIPTGVLFQAEQPSYEEHLGVAAKTPLARQNTDPARVNNLFKSFM